MSNKKEEKKSINDMIIEEAVKQFKEGKIQNSLDVESYLDGLLQPLMQKGCLRKPKILTSSII